MQNSAAVYSNLETALNPLDHAFLIHRLEPPPAGPLDVVLDTDTYNEIDDQFALVHALLSPERLRLQTIYAAPFQNARASSPKLGMEKSREEILRILELMNRPADGLVYSGSAAWMTGRTAEASPSVPSAARDHLIDLARNRSADDGPLYVIAIGAITNIASALFEAPEIREKIVLLWLGGHPLDWHTTHEFNLSQDPAASRLIFDSGVPLVLFPCRCVAEMIRTTSAELDLHLDGQSPIGTYLAKIFREYENQPMTAPGNSKEIWDLAPLGLAARSRLGAHLDSAEPPAHRSTHLELRQSSPPYSNRQTHPPRPTFRRPVSQSRLQR